MSKEIKRQLNRFELAEKKLFWIFSILVFTLAFSYGVFVNRAILNGVYSQKMSSSISKISQELNNLEYTYLESKNAITIDLALSKGFVQINEQKFVARNSPRETLSLITNEK